MRKETLKPIAAIAAAAIMVSQMAMPVFAASQYPEVAGGTTTFQKYLIVDAGANVPSATFQFEAEAGEAISASTSDNTTMQVLAGVDADKITFTDAVFSAADTADLKSSVQEGDIDVARTDRTNVKFDASNGEQYAKKTVTADFSQVKFDEPGIYRYIIKEKASASNAAKGITHDDDVDRVMDVYVVDDSTAASSVIKYTFAGNDYATENEAADAAVQTIAEEGGKFIFDGDEYDTIEEAEAAAAAAVVRTETASGGVGLRVAGYVMHTDVSNVAINETMGSADVENAGDALQDKTDGFTNEYGTKDLVFKKEVSGNQASRDKFFQFTLSLSGLTAGDKFVVSYADDENNFTTDGDADTSIAANPNSATTKITSAVSQPAELTANADGEINQVFYLQHGQKIAVRGLPVNATYAVTEDAEDYKSEAKAVSGFGDETSGTMTQDVNTSYLNTRDGVIPTGVLMTVIPGIAIVGAALLGMTMLGRSKKRNA